jgi:hypothetical protein
MGLSDKDLIPNYHSVSSSDEEVDSVVLKLARQVYWEYQRSLWDPDIATRNPDGEWHFHTWGAVGVLFMDFRSNRMQLNGMVEKSKTLVGAEQMNFIKKCLKTPNLRALLVVTEFPLIFERSKAANLHAEDPCYKDLGYLVSDLKEFEPILKTFASWLSVSRSNEL